MSRGYDIQEGMQVYGGDQLIGRVERLQGDGFYVDGLLYTRDMVNHVEHNRIYLGDAWQRAETTTTATTVGGHEVAAVAGSGAARDDARAENASGALSLHETVIEEEQTLPVTLRHEEVRVEEVDLAERPLQPDDDAFDAGVIRVPVRGEEAVVGKEAVIGEEVVDVAGIAARGRGNAVDEAYQRARGDLARSHTTRATGQGRTFEQTEPDYRTGFAAAHDERYAGRDFAAIEPELRSQDSANAAGGESWERRREGVRAGWDHARAATQAGQDTASPGASATDRLAIPLAEERVTVGMREVVIGEVVIRKRIVEEERMVPVIIRREIVEVVRLAPGESFPAGWAEDKA